MIVPLLALKQLISVFAAEAVGNEFTVTVTFTSIVPLDNVVAFVAITV